MKMPRRPTFVAISLLSSIRIAYGEQDAHKKSDFAAAADAAAADASDGPRIAIIGGGIGGSFASLYLSQYDSSQCRLGSITVFDPSPQLSTPDSGGRGRPGGPPSGGNFDDGSDWQGSRVSSLTLGDGKVVELGASIVYSGNRLVSDVVEADPNLTKAEPLSPGRDEEKREDDEGESMPDGFGVYDGNGVWDFVTTITPDYLVIAKMMYRYGLDLLRMRRAVLGAFDSFLGIYDLLDGTGADSFVDSPDDLWKAVGLHEPTTRSFDAHLDEIGISGGSKVSWTSLFSASLPAFFMPLFDSLEKWFGPSRGSLRREICESININNYNQANSRLDGLAGLVSFLPTQGSVYSVLGGNGQIISSAFRQAVEKRAQSCGVDGRISHVKSRITSVVHVGDAMQAWAGRTKLGDFDVIILAAPLQQSRVSFVEQAGGAEVGDFKPLAFNQLSSSHRFVTESPQLSRNQTLPSSTTRRYTQTITTIVSNATLQHDHFNLSRNSMPGSISMTERGKEAEGFSALSQLTADGTFKMFNTEPLSSDALERLFGPHHKVEYTKVWGGEHGGAYPDFNGGGESSVAAPFLLNGGESSGPALYYVNAIEASVAAMEISAIGAKAVSKLVARRVGLVS